MDFFSPFATQESAAGLDADIVYDEEEGGNADGELDVGMCIDSIDEIIHEEGKGCQSSIDNVQHTKLPAVSPADMQQPLEPSQPLYAMQTSPGMPLHIEITA